VEREGNLGKGVLTVLDSLLDVEKVLTPSTGELGQIAADGDFVYLEFRIRSQKPYILIDQDTVYNYRLDFGGLDYAYQTIVLCKYNYRTEEVIWWKRIGGLGIDELRDMLIDSDHNLIIHGWTSSGVFHFTETDSSFNNQENKPFIAKYDPEGNLIWSILNTNQNGELIHSIEVDKENNVYAIGEYNWTKYSIGDTSIYNQEYEPGNPTNRAILIKYDKEGIFRWIYQLDGSFFTSNIYDVSFDAKNDVLISGSFMSGEMTMGNMNYTDGAGEANLFLCQIDGYSGQYKVHAYDNGPRNKRFQNLCFNNSDNIIGYLTLTGAEEIYNSEFSSYKNEISGFMVKMTSDLMTSTEIMYHPGPGLCVYPNPTQGEFNLNMDGEIQSPFYLQIIDVNGRRVFDQNEVQPGETIRALNLSKGFYTVLIQLEDRLLRKKLIVQK
jgi:hypothetical protein